MSKKRDNELGMGQDILRRDFLNGFALGSLAAAASHPAIAGETTAAAAFEPATVPGYYPPALTGMRGSGYPAAYTVGHELRDHTLQQHSGPVTDEKESYDLVIVGGGISGLSAAYYCKKLQGADKKVLVLDNHDDFGGHAKRNQFSFDGRLRISNAGTFALYEGSEVTQNLLSEIGIDIRALAARNINKRFYSSLGMGMGVFFDKETFGEDKLVLDPAPWSDFRYMYAPLTPPNEEQLWKQWMQDAPLSNAAKDDVYRLYHEKREYLPGITVQARRKRLSEISYKDFILNVAGCNEKVAIYLRDRTFGSARGLDAISALNGYNRGLPGFGGMDLGTPETEDNDAVFHFPDGNATVARLLVRKLIPDALPGSTVEDSMTGRVDYALLDRSDSAIRIRLNSTAVNVKQSENEVEVVYSRGGRFYRAHGKRCVLACWHMIIPYICPELPKWQKEALAYQVKAPNLWVNVWLRNWQPFKKAGVNLINSRPVITAQSRSNNQSLWEHTLIHRVLTSPRSSPCFAATAGLVCH